MSTLFYLSNCFNTEESTLPVTSLREDGPHMLIYSSTIIAKASPTATKANYTLGSTAFDLMEQPVPTRRVHDRTYQAVFADISASSGEGRHVFYFEGSCSYICLKMLI